MNGALEGLTVIDLSRVRAGPSAVRPLADWGANVIKIEPPLGYDKGEDFGGSRYGSDFQNLQRNKRSLSLNLKSSDGVKILKRLIKDADVVVENFRPNVKTKLAIDYISMEKINPRLIYASISGFGQSGPYSSLPGFDQIAQGMGGIMSVTGLPGQGPVRAGIPVADLSAGLYCALGIMIALYERQKSGKGQWVSVSLLEAQIAMLDFQAARYLMEREVAGQAGNDHPTMAPMGVFKTADGYINIASAGNAMWKRLCKALDLIKLVKNPDFKDDNSRVKNRKKLNNLLNTVLASDSSAVWIKKLNTVSVPCGPIYSIDEVFSDPQVKHAGMAQSVKHKKLGNINLVGQPVTLSRTPSRLSTAAPEKGEHADEILKEYGYDPKTIAKFKREGTV